MMANTIIKWKFIPEKAACWRGFWKQKNCLKAAIRKLKQPLNDLTILSAEVESIVVALRITQVTSDHKDLEAFTPSHFENNRKYILSSIEMKIDYSAMITNSEIVGQRGQVFIFII